MSHDQSSSSLASSLAPATPPAPINAANATNNLTQNANNNDQPSTVLAYPLPPLQYINNMDINNLPEPPAPIQEGVYYMFGQKISLDDAIIAPLEALGTKRLYRIEEYEHKKELKKINASILVNFLDLIDVLVKCPDTEKRIEKCNDLATLFINFHHLINELRPHQARETIRVWLNTQKRTREEITKKLNVEMAKMTKVLEKYYEYEAKQQQQQSQEQQSEQQSQTMMDTSTTSNDKLNNNNNNLSQPASLDDIMCEIVDEFCG